VIFADASALIAIIVGEEEAERLADDLDADPARLCSALTVWETVAGLCRSYTFSVEAARGHVEQFLHAGEFEFIAIGERECAIALLAHATFGKGRHPAALNMGDCFAYACAKSHGAKLLYKGDDFAQTDVG
jgi:ribonuclease VapC